MREIKGLAQSVEVVLSLTPDRQAAVAPLTAVTRTIEYDIVLCRREGHSEHGETHRRYRVLFTVSPPSWFKITTRAIEFFAQKTMYQRNWGYRVYNVVPF